MFFLWSLSRNTGRLKPTGRCSGFKASQKTGQRLKVSSDRLGALNNIAFFCCQVYNDLFQSMFHLKKLRNIQI